MTVGDANFPFPDPSFLFIHEVTIKPVESTGSDPRGRAVVTYGLDQDEYGYLTAPDPSNEDSGGTERIRFAATLLLGRHITLPLESALIRSNDPQLPPRLAGTYKIEVVRPNISHTRCLLVRYDGPWEQNTEV